MQENIHGHHTATGYPMTPMGDYYENQGFASLRPCPDCGAKLRTHGRGSFFCSCGFQDEQHVEQYIAAGLDYALHVTGAHKQGQLF